MLDKWKCPTGAYKMGLMVNMTGGKEMVPWYEGQVVVVMMVQLKKKLTVTSNTVRVGNTNFSSLYTTVL